MGRVIRSPRRQVNFESQSYVTDAVGLLALSLQLDHEKGWTPTYRTVLPTANFLLLLCCLCVVSAAFRSVVECRFWSRLGPKTGGSFTEVKRWGHAAFFFLPFGHRVCNGSMDPLVAFFEPLPHRQV